MKNVLTLTVLVLITFLLLVTHVKAEFTEKQITNLQLAGEIGAEYGWPETAQVIIMQESFAGKDVHGDENQSPGRRTYGLGHMSLNTAKFIIKRHFGHPVFQTDEEIIDALVTNKRFAIHMTMWYFEYLLKINNGDWKKALLSYNVGAGNVKKHGFEHDPNNYLSKSIWRLKNQIRPFNRRA